MRPPSRQCLFASRWSAGVMGRLVCSGRTAGLGRTGRASRVHARVLFTKAHTGGCTSVRALLLNGLSFLDRSKTSAACRGSVLLG